MALIRRLDTAQSDFDTQLAGLLAFDSAQDARVDSDVAGILAAVKKDGDAAGLAYTHRFDRPQAVSVAGRHGRRRGEKKRGGAAGPPSPFLCVPFKGLGDGARGAPRAEWQLARKRISPPL